MLWFRLFNFYVVKDIFEFQISLSTIHINLNLINSNIVCGLTFSRKRTVQYWTESVSEHTIWYHDDVLECSMRQFAGGL